MKLLYSGASFCDHPTFKRLLLIAEEIQFIDRPSVTFENWGTIGSETPARKINASGSPVEITTISPPSGPSKHLYAPYIEADLNSPSFVSTVIQGLNTSNEFASRFVQPQANYGDGVTGAQIIDALRRDPELSAPTLVFDPTDSNLFDISTHKARKNTLKVILFEASIIVTSALLAAEYTGALPISEDSHVAKLIATRTSDSAYVGNVSKAAPFLGLNITQAVIPDEALQRLEIHEILKYRDKTNDAYVAWSTEINRLAANMTSPNGGDALKEFPQIIATDIKPKLVEYENEMRAIRDDMFSDIIKKVSAWEMPTLSLAFVTGLGFAEAIALFLGALSPAIPDTVDYFKNRKNIERSNAMAYLIRLTRS